MRWVTFILSSTVLVFTCTVLAQVPVPFQQGAIFTGSYQGGDVDQVNLQNGSLSFKIPLYSLPQLGKLKLSYSLVFNSNNLRPNTLCYTDYTDLEEPVTTCVEESMLSGNPDPGLVLDQWEVVYPSYPCGGSCGIDTNQAPTYYLSGSDGSSHLLAPNSGSHNTLYSTDGSGDIVHTTDLPTESSSGCPEGEYNYQYSAYAIDPDAITHDWSEDTGCITPPIPPLPSRISDRSGNHISLVDGSSIWPVTDSVGRVVPAFPASTNGNTTGCPNLGVSNQTAVDSRSWIVPGPNGGSVTYLFCYTSITYNANEESAELPDGEELWGPNGWADVLQSVVLPNGTYWGFVYNSDGMYTGTVSDYTALPEAHPEIRQLIYPTGGSITYAYQAGSACNDFSDDARTVISRQPSGTSKPWTYVYSTTSAASSPFISAATVTDPAGNDTVHQYTASDNSACFSTRETSVTRYQGHASGGQLLESETKQYANMIALGIEDTGVADINVQPSATTKQLAGGTTTITTFNYPTVANPALIQCNYPTDVFLNGACEETGSYAVLFANPTSTVTVDPAGQTTTSFTDYEWQQTGNTSNALAANDLMLPTSNCLVSGTASSCASPTSAASYTSFLYDSNGDQLSHSSYDSKLASWVTTSQTYTSTGMVHTITDPNLNMTTIAYDSSGLFPSQVTRPATANAAHVSYFNYDDNTGNLLVQVDENGSSISDSAHMTNYQYDAAGRLTDVQAPPVDGQRAETQTCYTDLGGGICGTSSAPYSIYKQVIANADPNQLSHVALDGFGRSAESVGPDGAKVDTVYDNLGRVQSVSNPYFSMSDSTYGTTTFSYDALNRKTIQTQPDSSTIQWCYSGVQTTGQANCSSNASSISAAYWIDVTDEIGIHSQQVMDGLGHLVAVVEPDAASGVLLLQTYYSYDVLGNLTGVAQNGKSGDTARTRSFSYSTLSRLFSSNNPETGSIGYSYDLNGNLTLKTDARGATVNYGYDQLNRLISKVATFGSVATSNCYRYDAGTPNFIGHLSEEWTQVASSCPSSPPSSTSMQTHRFIQTYDAMGRILSEQRCVLTSCSTSTPFTLGSAYDLAGNLTMYTTGAGTLAITNSYDYGGRLSSVTSSVFDSTHPESLYNATGFAATGAPQTFTLGSYLSVIRGYDQRLRANSLSTTAR